MKHEESRIQEACVNWFRLQYPKLAPALFAVPNGGKRNSRLAKTKNGYKTVSPEGTRLKREGVIPGVADLILLYPNGNHHSLAIEMKTKTGRQSPSQKEWQKSITALGVNYVVVRSTFEFIEVVDNYLKNTYFGKKSN